jgi:hypothetical protein
LLIIRQQLKVLVRHELPKRQNVFLDEPLVVFHLKVLQEIGTLEALLVHSILTFLRSSLHQLTEFEVRNAAIVVFVPVFVVPRLAQGQELVLC